MSEERIKIELGGGFAIMLSLLYLLLGARMLGAVLAAALIHELGHLAALALTGVKVDKVRLGATGACICRSSGGAYWETAASALAGPAAGLLFYLLILPFDKSCASASLALSALNLLPASGLDGGAAAHSLCAFFFGLSAADRVLCLSSCAVSLTLFILSFLSFNLMLCLISVCLLIDLAKDLL